MSRLEASYLDQVDFIHIDWDDSDSDPVLQYFGIFNRSNYLLLTPEGEVIFRWFGPLSETAVRDQIDLALETYQ